MSGLEQRPDKQRVKPVHRQEPAQRPDAHAAPRLPVKPDPKTAEAGKSEERDVTLEPVLVPQQRDALGAALLALTGKGPKTATEVWHWGRAGQGTAQAPAAGNPPSTQTLPPWHPLGAALEALTGRPAHVMTTQDADAVWPAMVAAVTAQRTVLAGGGDDVPDDRHGRPRIVQVLETTEWAGERAVTIQTPEGGSASLPLSAFCRTFAEVALDDAM